MQILLRWNVGKVDIMRIIAITQKAPNKHENEDRIIVGKSIVAEGNFVTEITDGCIAIADGVGGHNAGYVASHFVANNLAMSKNITVELLEHINAELLELAKSKDEYRGMATTLSGIELSQEHIRLFSVGNTRIYTIQSGKYLKQLTTDDTTLNYLLTTRQLKQEEADSFDRKNEITACFGGGAIDLCKIKLNVIEQLSSPVLMTSDGIHDHISIDQMEDIISECGISSATCEKMIEAARNSGSTDDISILLGVV